MTHELEIQRLLEDFNLSAIDLAGETIYAMWPDLTLAYVNQGWNQFAAQNGGEPRISSNWPIGCHIEDAIAPILRPFFVENFAKCLRERRPWEHRYECSSSDYYRSFIMMTYPLGGGEGLLVVNSLVQESKHTRIAHQPFDELYRDHHGIIKQCCHCRRVQRCDAKRVWDWVPEWVSVFPSRTSHGLCDPCFGFYYANPHRSLRGFPETFVTGD